MEIFEPEGNADESSDVSETNGELPELGEIGGNLDKLDVTDRLRIVREASDADDPREVFKQYDLDEKSRNFIMVTISVKKICEIWGDITNPEELPSGTLDAKNMAMAEILKDLDGPEMMAVLMMIAFYATQYVKGQRDGRD